MKALVYTDVRTLSYEEFQEPTPQFGEALVRVESVGICGSDMHAYLGHDNRRPAPLILGHEAAGTIVGGPRNGDRVTINPLVTCGACPACFSGRENLCASRQIISMPPREGAFAELVRIPETNLVTVPQNISLAQAALAEPIAVGWHAARLGVQALHASEPRRALVIGGGAIGVAAVLSLQAMGVEEVVIVERNDKRREYLASTCGMQVAQEVRGEFPLVVDAVGFAATRAAASAIAKPGGVILHIGLGEDTGGLDVRRVTLQEITLIGTYTYTAQDFRDTAAAMFDGRLGTLDWVESRPLSGGANAFQDILEGRVAAPKIILKPDA